MLPGILKLASAPIVGLLKQGTGDEPPASLAGCSVQISKGTMDGAYVFVVTLLGGKQYTQEFGFPDWLTDEQVGEMQKTIQWYLQVLGLGQPL